MSIIELQKAVQIFCEERDWTQFHNPKDLAIGISTEANELLDIFRFKSSEQIEEMFLDEESKKNISDELADTFFFILRFAQLYNIDLTEALSNKMQKNQNKYPVEKVSGKNLKYNEY